MDLSLRDLADRCGVSAPMLSQVERGRRARPCRSPPRSRLDWSCACRSCCALMRKVPSASSGRVSGEGSRRGCHLDGAGPHHG
nr:helix-turn-helix transcriptional regulator [Conexibacter sp. DBS9H8]